MILLFRIVFALQGRAFHPNARAHAAVVAMLIERARLSFCTSVPKTGGFCASPGLLITAARCSQFHLETRGTLSAACRKQSPAAPAEISNHG